MIHVVYHTGVFAPALGTLFLVLAGDRKTGIYPLCFAQSCSPIGGMRTSSQVSNLVLHGAPVMRRPPSACGVTTRYAVHPDIALVRVMAP